MDIFYGIKHGSSIGTAEEEEALEAHHIPVAPSAECDPPKGPYLRLTKEQIESSIAMTEMSNTERVLVMAHLRELSAGNPDPVREAAEGLSACCHNLGVGFDKLPFRLQIRLEECRQALKETE